MANRNNEALRARAGEMIQRLGEFALIQQRRRHLQNAELARECAELIALLTPRPEPAGRVEAVAWQYRWKCDPTGFVYSTLVHPLEGNAPTPDEIEWWVYGVKPVAASAREGVPEGYVQIHKNALRQMIGEEKFNAITGLCVYSAAPTAGEGAKQQ